MTEAATAEPIGPDKIARNEKFLTLHHELLYPAFLGAVMFEFAKKALPGFLPIDLHWFTLNARWSSTALWFMLYFSIAFLALHDASRCTRSKQHFGWIPFVANFLEIAIILLIFVALPVHVATNPAHGQEPAKIPESIKIEYVYIFLGWTFIPITAAISNYFSRRVVLGTLSIIAFAIGVIGLALGRSGIDWEHDYWYDDFLIAMYLALFGYYVSVFCPKAMRGSLWLTFEMRPSSCFPVRVS